MSPLRLMELDGIGPVNAALMAGEGITTVDAFLRRASTPKGREELSRKTGIQEDKILYWVKLADLLRVSGMKESDAELLEAAGVQNVGDLKTKSAGNLYNRMKEINELKHMVKILPALAIVENWIQVSKTLDAIISF